MIPTITAAALKARLQALGKARKSGLVGEELAIVDVRELAVFGDAHLFHGRSLPLSRLEALAESLLPCRSVPIILCDGGEPDGQCAMIAAARLVALGYEKLAVLEGGVAAWASAGYEIFSGVNVPSKAFGEFVELRFGTPHITADELNRRQLDGDKMIILDSRPFDEFYDMSIPGGIDTPGAELVHRVFEVAPDPDDLVVVNCAGRTRSIIGAQSLINAGVPHRVAALKDGTMGWELAGLTLDHGQEQSAPPPGPDALEKAMSAAAAVRRRFNIPLLSSSDLAAWQEESQDRSLFLLDVRTQEEHQASHPEGFSWAPGGQLVQATDETIGPLGARVVLYDDQEVRAVMTASWLVQMGWYDVAVWLGDNPSPFPASPSVKTAALPQDGQTVSALELRAILDSGEPAAVLDLAPSADYERGHIPGAAWALRGQFEAMRPFLAGYGLIILTADDPLLIAPALSEVKPVVPQALLYGLEGGNASWRTAGLPLEAGMTWALCDRLDVWEKPYESESRMRDYLTWEVGLVDQVNRDGDAGFRWFDD
ncbi:MAG: rhodanese-like domain-containing protein [Pseudomonadota bacterium]